MYIGLSQINALNDSLLNLQGRRRNAEAAYSSHEKYSGDKKKEVQRLLAAQPTAVSKQQFEQLGAGQVKQVHLPIGKTLEETITLWRDVRTEALSVPEPTTADYQLAAKASSQIRQAEAQLGLHARAHAEIDAAVKQEFEANMSQTKMEFPTTIDRELFEREKKYERAISSYSFQVQMKMNGFQIDSPSFFKIA